MREERKSYQGPERWGWLLHGCRVSVWDVEKVLEIDNGDGCINTTSVQFSLLVMSNFANPRIAARQSSLSITNYWSLLKLMSIASVMPSNHLILCHPLFPLLLPPCSSVQSVSRVRLFVTLWTAARQASLSITNSRSLLKLMSIASVMPSNHLILCRPFPSTFNLSHDQGLFKWISSLHQVAKVLKFQLQH